MMNFEELLVSGAPTEIYALSGSLFEFHETVMKPGRAETAGIQFLFQLYGGAYYRHTANLDMMIDQDHPWSKELIDLKATLLGSYPVVTVAGEGGLCCVRRRPT